MLYIVRSCRAEFVQQLILKFCHDRGRVLSKVSVQPCLWLREILIASLNSEVNSIVITYFNRSLKSIFYGDSSQDSICRAEHAVRWISPRLGVSQDNVWNKERLDRTRIWEDHLILLCYQRLTRKRNCPLLDFPW